MNTAESENSNTFASPNDAEKSEQWQTPTLPGYLPDNTSGI